MTEVGNSRMNRLRGAWKALRRRYWWSLGFDLALIAAAFWLIHAWNTRNLPIDEVAPALPTLTLQARAGDSGIPPGQAGVVYFFAPWCFYCKHSIDNLERLVQSGAIAWASAVALAYEDRDAVRGFVQETGFTQPVLLGDARTARDWNVSVFPSYFVIDAEGRIRSRSVGYSTAIGLRARNHLAGG